MASLPFTWRNTPEEKIIADEIDIIATEITDRDEADSAEEAIDDSLVEGVEKRPLIELDTRETIITAERGPEVLRTLLGGLPSPRSGLLTFLTVAINVALAAMVADLVYRAPLLHPEHKLSMARVGYVSDKTASILVREPHGSQYPVFLSYRHADAPLDINSGLLPHDTSWKSAGSLPWLDETTDYTGTFHLTGLKPDTRYQYAASTNHSGYFVTAPRTGQTSSRHQGTYTFLHSSCIKARFPYSPFSHPLSVPGFRHLAAQLPKLGAQFMLFLGDFIYIDVPHRFGSSVETYRREYRQVYASPDWPLVSSPSSHPGFHSSSLAASSSMPNDLPWIHVLDDHEIANDWDRNTSSVYQSAVDPWTHYHVAANPPAVRPGATYFSFVQGPASFFMLDTRRYRDPFDGTDGSYNPETNRLFNETGGYKKSMLGSQQLSDLLAWLAREEPTGVRWKVVVSSIPFTKNWRFGSEDTWGGYLGERQTILEAMWDVGLRGGVGVVVLSGDRHEFAATAFPPPPEGKVVGLSTAEMVKGVVGNADGGLKVKRWPLSATVHEFSASPLSMFYLPVRTYKQTDDEDVCVK